MSSILVCKSIPRDEAEGVWCKPLLHVADNHCFIIKTYCPQTFKVSSGPKKFVWLAVNRVWLFNKTITLIILAQPFFYLQLCYSLSRLLRSSLIVLGLLCKPSSIHNACTKVYSPSIDMFCYINYYQDILAQFCHLLQASFLWMLRRRGSGTLSPSSSHPNFDHFCFDRLWNYNLIINGPFVAYILKSPRSISSLTHTFTLSSTT